MGGRKSQWEAATASAPAARAGLEAGVGGVGRGEAGAPAVWLRQPGKGDAQPGVRQGRPGLWECGGLRRLAVWRSAQLRPGRPRSSGELEAWTPPMRSRAKHWGSGLRGFLGRALVLSDGKEPSTHPFLEQVLMEHLLYTGPGGPHFLSSCYMPSMQQALME